MSLDSSVAIDTESSQPSADKRADRKTSKDEETGSVKDDSKTGASTSDQIAKLSLDEDRGSMKRSAQKKTATTEA
jgi:hypothetical protein